MNTLYVRAGMRSQVKGFRERKSLERCHLGLKSVEFKRLYSSSEGENGDLNGVITGAEFCKSGRRRRSADVISFLKV